MEEYSDEEFLRKKSSGEEFLRKVYNGLATSDEVRRAVIRYNNQNSDSQVRGGANVEAIQTYLDRQEYILSRIDEERVRNLFYDHYVIKEENVPTSYFELQERIALERGYGHVEYNEDLKHQEIGHIINEQKTSLNSWLDYFASEETSYYPTWFKYFCFQGMTRIGYYDKGKDEYTKRTKTTTKPYIELNREAIAMLYDKLIKSFESREITDESLKKLIEGGSFSKLYLYCIKKIDSVDKDKTDSDDGIWKKYKMGSDPKILFNDIHGKGTGWCTAGGIETATSHLNGGDFYVYYTKDRNGSYTQPRIAIKMIGSSIGEIRGIGPSQNIEPNMLKVVEEKLKEFPDRDAYKKKAHDMEMLTYIYTKFKNNPNCELTIEELKFLYEIDEKINGFGYGQDPRINEIIEFRNKRNDIALIFNITLEQVSLTKDEALNDDKLVHYGNLFFSEFENKGNIKLPRIIIGDLDFYSLRSAEGLKLPETLNGGLYLSSLRSAEGLKMPETLNGSLYLNSLTSTKGLELPKTINGDLFLSSLTSAKGLKLPEILNGGLYLSSLRSAEGLKLPEILNGDLDLSSLISTKGLELSETLNGNLYLRSLRNAEGSKLPEILNGNLHLDRLISTKGLELPEVLNGSLDLHSLRSGEGLKLPETLNGYLDLSILTSAEGLIIPDSLDCELICPLANNNLDTLREMSKQKRK